MRAFESMRTVVLLGVIAVVGLGCPPTNQTPPDASTETPDAGNPETDAGTPDAGDGCLAIELGAQDFQANLFGQLTGVRFGISPPIDEPAPESLIVELYDSTTPNLPPLQPGTFALGTAPNDSLATCQHCLWIPIDWDGVSPLSRVFLATEGSITLTVVEDPLSAIFAGSTTEVLFREATIDETGATTLVDGGRCARVPAFTFDTSPTPGRACLSAEDCGNPLLEICSPATGTCAAHECGDLHGCPSSRPVCLTQYGNSSEGACYAMCEPLEPNTGCPTGQVCTQLGVDPRFGICLRSGDGELGESCSLEDTSTSCAPEMTCSAISLACTQTCEFFASNPGCQANHACNVLGVCDPLSAGVDVDFGQPCGNAAALAQGCAADSGAFRGICFAFKQEDPLVCEEACFDDLGCEPEEFCALRFSSGLGICLPDPVCGDGALGEIGEVCDDGNTVSGDGCSSDCQTVEYAAICPNAPLLSTGSTFGDTTNAWDGFKATCQLGVARAEVYRFAPPSRGRLKLTVNSPTPHTVSVRTTCADPASELACGAGGFSTAGELIHQVTSEEELTVLVSAFTVLEQGPFALEAEFVAESCGDGIVAGLEVCDDGNTTSNDGCSNDCSTIEYATYCAQAPALPMSATGNNTGAPAIYSSSCSNTFYGSGPDRLFHYTAPSAGTLRVRLEPTGANPADLVLAVFDSCGTPSTMTELDCSSVYDIEEVEVPVTAGQTVTVLVEGFHAHSVGAFTLTAELLP